MIATEFATALGHDLGFGSVDDVTDAITADVPAYAGMSCDGAEADGIGVDLAIRTRPASSATALATPTTTASW